VLKQLTNYQVLALLPAIAPVKVSVLPLLTAHKEMMAFVPQVGTNWLANHSHFV
jgi:glycyl-tRNA synthetase (class II)